DGRAVHVRAQQLGELVLGLERDHLGGEPLELDGMGTDPGAHVEHAPVQPRPGAVDEPLVVRGRAGHRVEVVGERVRHAWEDTAVRVCVLSTSYPRSADDVAGRFVADAVEHLRAAGVDVDVVSPASFPHFGIAYGSGIVQNLRARPWLALALPLFLAPHARAARRAPREADVELARRCPRLARPLVERARVVVAASSYLAEEARRLGARDVRVIPTGVEIPASVGEPAQPPHVLFVGRLSEEKGILEFLAATEGLPRVIVGDGPLRARVPEAVGFVPHDRLGAYYERAAVVCVPSRREGYGVVAREAMAYGRPVVATRVGGLVDAVSDGETGLLVP